MSDDNEVVFQVQYRTKGGESWKHYYSDVSKEEALEMYARHVSYYNKEQCRFVRVTESTELFVYVPVDQEEEDE